VHLLDFGIAKLIEPGPSTAAATARVMTPEYASPEQLRGAPVGTGSDIYSLGVLLFELLTGRRPPDAAKQAEAGPPLASQSAPDAARQRALRGDLDAILSRALAQRPEDRYPTMQALADDLQRFLNGDAVLARPANPLYRLQRTLRRHKAASAAAGVLLLALAGGAYAQALAGAALAAGAGLALWQRNQARQEAARAREAQQRAEEVKAFIASIFTEAVPRSGQGGTVTARDLLEGAAQRLDGALTAQPEVMAELGALIGNSLNELGETHSALPLLPRIVQRCESVLGATHPLTLQSRWRWAEAANSVGDLAQSEPVLGPLLRDLRAVRPGQPRLLVSALGSQAFLLTKRGQEEQALAALREAVSVASHHLGDDHTVTLSARSAWSNTLVHFGRPAQALEAIAPALQQARATLGHQRPHVTLVQVERCHADALARNNRPREGAALLAQVLADQQALDAAPTGRVRSAMTLYAYALIACGQLREGLQVGQASLDLHRQLTGGLNHEGAAIATRCAFAAAMLGDWARAQQLLDSAQASVQGLTDAPWMVCERQLTQLLMRRGTGPTPEMVPPTPSLQARLLRVVLLRARTLGEPDHAEAAAQALLAHLAGGTCNALEAGLGWAEAARCARDAGRSSLARQRFDQALQVWADGQVDGADVLAPVQAERAALPQPD
jgi:serine/threonine-protein kinase